MTTVLPAHSAAVLRPTSTTQLVYEFPYQMLEGSRSKLWGQRLAPLSGTSFLAHHRPVESEPLQILPGIMFEKLQKTHSGGLRGHLLKSVGQSKPSRVPEMPSAFISCLTGTRAFSGETVVGEDIFSVDTRFAILLGSCLFPLENKQHLLGAIELKQRK